MKKLYDKIHAQVSVFNEDQTAVYSKLIQNKLNKHLEDYDKSLSIASQKVMNQGVEKVLKQLS